MIHLERFCYSDVGVFGEMHVGDFSCYTVERPWLDNKANVSCIPQGDYTIDPDAYYHRGGYDCVEVLGVQGRTLIKVHRGNTMLNVKGCIAVGEELGFINGMWAVTNSAATFALFMGAVKHLETNMISIVRKEL